MSDEPKALTLRLPADLHEQLRLHSFFTRISINQTAKTVLARWWEEEGQKELSASRHLSE